MWNEFEHVEDGRFDPNRDGEHGEYRKSHSDYDYIKKGETTGNRNVPEPVIQEYIPGDGFWDNGSFDFDAMIEELEWNDLDYYELICMPKTEQDRLLEQAGLDPDDFWLE